MTPSVPFEAAYEKGPILGRGASGVAFVVRPKKDPKLEHVAKEICLTRVDEKRRREAFAESRLLRELRHEHIVTLLDVVEECELLYIVMEYATGGDLARRIQAQKAEGTRFSEAVVLRVFAQVCSALHYIHAQKIMHRDVKPANVFIAGEGELGQCTVKLGDFGIAKMIEGTGQANSTVGTPSYLSPEMCKNNPYGMKADVWSLGVAWYEMVCLKVPFSASNLPAMALLICTSDPKPLPEEYSPEIQALIFSLLQKDPVKRPAMSAVVEEPSVKAAMPEPLESPRGWLRRLPEIDETPLAESLGGPEDDHGNDHRRLRGKRRCRANWIEGQEPLDGGYVRSPVRHANRRNPEAQASPDSHSSTPLPLTTPALSRPGARSVSPARSAAGGAGGAGGSVPVPLGMRTSGSAPSLPPLPPLMNQSRGSVRSRISIF